MLSVQTKTNYGFTFEDIQKICNYKIIAQSAEETQFENGLIYVDVKISYIDLEGNINNLNQIFVTTSYKRTPIINLVTKEKNISLQQVLCNTYDYGNFISSKNKNICLQETTIDFNDYYTSSFISTKDLRTNKILLEKYKRNYYCVGEEKENGQLLNLLGASSKELKFILSDRNFVYTQMDGVGIIDTEMAVNFVNAEIDKLISMAYKKIETVEKRYKKRIKNKE